MDAKERMANRYRDLCRMFIKIAARAAESDESYNKVANSAEQLAQDVEKCLKIRTYPDLGNSSTSEGTNISSNRILKHNEGLPKPRGIKVKEKTVRGSRRPISGFEEAMPKKKKSTQDSVQLQPQGTTTRLLEVLTNQMPAYQSHHNPILNAPMQPSVDTTMPVSLQPYNASMV